MEWIWFILWFVQFLVCIGLLCLCRSWRRQNRELRKALKRQSQLHPFTAMAAKALFEAYILPTLAIGRVLKADKDDDVLDAEVVSEREDGQ